MTDKQIQKLTQLSRELWTTLETEYSESELISKIARLTGFIEALDVENVEPSQANPIRKTSNKTHPCEQCGTPTHRDKFCSMECYHKSRIGKNFLRKKPFGQYLDEATPEVIAPPPYKAENVHIDKNGDLRGDIVQGGAGGGPLATNLVDKSIFCQNAACNKPFPESQAVIDDKFKFCSEACQKYFRSA